MSADCRPALSLPNVLLVVDVFFFYEQASVFSRDVTLRAPVVSLPHSCGLKKKVN